MVISFTPFVTQIGIQVPVPRRRAPRRGLQLQAAGCMTRWLLIAGDFTPLGGMDRANHALASSLLARPGAEVHLVAHRVWQDLAARPGVHVDLVRRPFGSHFSGGRFSRPKGSSARRPSPADTSSPTAATPTRGMSRGSTTCTPHTRRTRTGTRRRIQTRHHASLLPRAGTRRAEARAAGVCATVSAPRTTSHERLGIGPDRTRVVSLRLRPGGIFTGDGRRAGVGAARTGLGVRLAGRPVRGALGDRRKGFDRLFAAWRELCRDRGWDADLAVAGQGSELARWQRLAIEAGLERRITFLGFRKDVSRMMAAADALVHPARYEAYGLGVHEALCRGLPAIVSAAAGIAERYPQELSRSADPERGRRHRNC